jgi:hypothetical protein
MLSKLLEILSKFLTGLVTRLASGKNGLTKADRARLLTLFLFTTFFEFVMAMNLVFLWLLFKP